jgi:phytoene desaturase
MTKAIIVGGGLGGLALALRLRAAGWQVTILEHKATLGGKMNRFSERGFRFDTGPSLITMPHVFAELFAAAGERMEDHLAFERVDPHAEYVFPDGVRIRCPDDVGQWIQTIRAIEPRDAAGFEKFWRLGARLYQLSERTFFARGIYAPPRLRDLAMVARIPLRLGWGNYARAVESLFRSPHLRQIYNRFPTYVGSSPYLCPATLLVIPYIEHRFGAWYVRGGLYRIVESLASLACGRGIEIRTSARVTAIDTHAGRVTGVHLESGERIAAQAVAMNGDAATLRALLGNGAVRENGKRSLSGLVMLFGIRRLLENVCHHTVLFSRDYQAEFDDLFVRREFPRDPTVYVSVPSIADRSIAPENCDCVFAMANAPAGPVKPESFETVRHRVLERLQSGGFPDLQNLAVVCDIWTPERFAGDYLCPGGAIYGEASHDWRGAFLRPSNKDRRIRGLFRVGGSSHPGGGTPTVLMSARITADAMGRP